MGSSRSCGQRLDERASARLVAIERRPAAAAFVDDVELDLGACLQFFGEERGGLQREVPQRVVESTVAHATRFRRRDGGPPGQRPAELGGDRLGGRGGHGTVVDAEVLAPVAAHVLDQRDERSPFGVSEYSTRGGTSG